MNFSCPELPSPEWLSTDGAAIERLVLHCWAEWNERYDTEMHEQLTLAQKKLLPIDIRIRSVNADNEAFGPFMKEHKVGNLPALIIFSKGIQLKTHVGLVNAENALTRIFVPDANIPKGIME